jgi:hypothetical protein
MAPLPQVVPLILDGASFAPSLPALVGGLTVLFDVLLGEPVRLALWALLRQRLLCQAWHWVTLTNRLPKVTEVGVLVERGPSITRTRPDSLYERGDVSRERPG